MDDRCGNLMFPCGGANLRRAASQGPDGEECPSGGAADSGREPGRGPHSAWGINNPASPGDGMKREDGFVSEEGCGEFSMGKEDEIAVNSIFYYIS